MRPQRVPVNLYEAREALVLVAADAGRHARGRLRRAAPRRPADAALLGPRAQRRARASTSLHEWEYGGYERQLELPAGYGGGVEATPEERPARRARPARRRAPSR